MEFVLLMCLPIVIMTQMPAFDQSNLPPLVVVTLSVIIIFPVILVIFFLIRLLRGIWKEFKETVKDVMHSTPNLFGKMRSSRNLSVKNTNDTEEEEEDGPTNTATAPKDNDNGTDKAGLELAISNRMRLQQLTEIQSDSAYSDPEGGLTGVHGTPNSGMSGTSPQSGYGLNNGHNALTVDGAM